MIYPVFARLSRISSTGNSDDRSPAANRVQLHGASVRFVRRGVQLPSWGTMDGHAFQIHSTGGDRLLGHNILDPALDEGQRAVQAANSGREFTAFTFRALSCDNRLLVSFQIWNLSIALVSGVCASVMTQEYFTSTFSKGFYASLCSTRDTFYAGNTGRAVFVLIFARLPEFIDTIFIVLRKQPLLFIHYYHHAFTLCYTWYTYSSACPSARHAIYVNALIHTVMYSYYFLTTLKIRPPAIVARCITLGQIVQFVYILYAFAHVTVVWVVLQKPCEIDATSLSLTWFMDLSYLYLFIDFYLRKYRKKTTEKTKKIE
ncbi:hypothetical protein PRIPAC_90142 [Pristionchus pacificus]|uniref:Elongation of very long chain fatty acids protein n=1 Tax=Pristionchus pacificus TaxID=54126 RepID=A0A2A6CYL6_PRIPA|nr:hypothetical protein PRIPAC_90142 [Pristionchus pacificus]|eukprot:PDM83200.1 hypothetical protein PRIPAC_37593 [Pristionchus pacificus]